MTTKVKLRAFVPKLFQPIQLKRSNILADKKITATFNEAMDPANNHCINLSVQTRKYCCAGAVTYSGIVATFSPTASLLPFTLYSATITKAAKDPDKNALVADYLWSLTTQPLVSLSSSPIIGGTTTGAVYLTMAQSHL